MGLWRSGRSAVGSNPAAGAGCWATWRRKVKGLRGLGEAPWAQGRLGGGRLPGDFAGAGCPAIWGPTVKGLCCQREANWTQIRPGGSRPPGDLGAPLEGLRSSLGCGVWMIAGMGLPAGSECDVRGRQGTGQRYQPAHGQKTVRLLDCFGTEGGWLGRVSHLAGAESIIVKNHHPACRPYLASHAGVAGGFLISRIS